MNKAKAVTRRTALPFGVNVQRRPSRYLDPLTSNTDAMDAIPTPTRQVSLSNYQIATARSYGSGIASIAICLSSSRSYGKR